MGAGSVVGKSSALSAELRGLEAKTPETPVYSGVSAHQQALRHRMTECPVLWGFVQFCATSVVFVSHTDRTTQRTTRVSQATVVSSVVACRKGPGTEISPAGQRSPRRTFPAAFKLEGVG